MHATADIGKLGAGEPSRAFAAIGENDMILHVAARSALGGGGIEGVGYVSVAKSEEHGNCTTSGVGTGVLGETPVIDDSVGVFWADGAFGANELVDVLTSDGSAGDGAIGEADVAQGVGSLAGVLETSGNIGKFAGADFDGNAVDARLDDGDMVAFVSVGEAEKGDDGAEDEDDGNDAEENAAIIGGEARAGCKHGDSLLVLQKIMKGTCDL